MATLTVGSGQQYSTIAQAVAASSSGDTIDVMAGTYTNDFVTISHDLTLQAVGGTVTMVETEDPPDGKAMIDEGGSGVSVTISGFDISGVSVPDGNGAAIRYEGGSLTLTNDDFHDNQEGLLGAADPAGSITIENSTFADNGTGTGSTHNIYVGEIDSFTITDSTITGADVGHDIKSRAANNVIENNVITDGSTGTASYEIDLPNGGNATISGNVIEKGANASNPIAIAYGEESDVYSSNSLSVTGNSILDDDTSSPSTTTVWNDTSTTASITGNTLWGWANTVTGPATVSDNTVPTTEPSLSSLISSLESSWEASATAGTTTSSGGASSSGTSSVASAGSGTASATPVSAEHHPSAWHWRAGGDTPSAASDHHAPWGSSVIVDPSHTAWPSLYPSPS